MEQQQKTFYVPLIQDNLGEPVPGGIKNFNR